MFLNNIYVVDSIYIAKFYDVTVFMMCVLLEVYQSIFAEMYIAA